MKNPLIKRLPREFAGEIAKYIVIFIFMTAVIGLISALINIILKMVILNYIPRLMISLLTGLKKKM